MIIFHEGLPGSGKSYAAMKDHILPALAKGRQVWAYLEGINDPFCREKIRSLLNIETERLDELLHPITREQVPTWHKVCPNDCLIILDELQNFYPSGKQRLDDATTQAVAEHRHKGQDILGMGQDLRDCHSLWKRRVDQRIVFNQLSSLGMSNRYSWKVMKSVGLEKFEEVSKGVATYDPQYFGSYKSHVDSAANKETFKDDRANVFKSKFFRLVMPFALVVGCVGLWKLYDVGQNGFGPSKPSMQAPKPVQTGPGTPIPTPAVYTPTTPVPLASAKEAPLPSEAPISAPQDRVQQLSQKYRIRVGGYWEGRGKRNGFIEWRDESNTLRNRFTFDEMQGMGYTVMANQFGTVVTIVNGPIHFIATMWPLDSHEGVANQAQVESTRGVHSKPGASTSSDVELPTTETITPNPMPQVSPTPEKPKDRPQTRVPVAR